MSTFTNHPHATHPCERCDNDALVFSGWTTSGEAMFTCDDCGHEHVCLEVTRGD